MYIIGTILAVMVAVGFSWGTYRIFYTREEPMLRNMVILLVLDILCVFFLTVGG